MRTTNYEYSDLTDPQKIKAEKHCRGRSIDTNFIQPPGNNDTTTNLKEHFTTLTLNYTKNNSSYKPLKTLKKTEYNERN